MNLNAELAFLSRLRFVSHRRRRGGTWGERRSTHRGAGLEFADYRDYVPGDDPRRVDWNLYARLDRPYVRLYEEEEDLAISVLLDGSASMAWGDGDRARWPVARGLTTALGALSLLSGDLLRGGLLHEDALVSRWGPARGRGRLVDWEAWASDLVTTEVTSMTAALKDFAVWATRPGLVLLISDGYDMEGLYSGVSTLAQRGHEVVFLHVLTPEELAPQLRGDLRLVDAETGERREVTVDRATLAAYATRLADWQSALRALMGQHGGRYVLLRTDLALRRMLLEELRRVDVVR